MKNNYLTLLFLFSICFGFSQTKDSLSVEEQARREKNIQAGNPFKEFGYKPKIATLSKGKYLEFHDLDSIVQVGTFMYNTRLKSIVSIIQKDTLPLSEATLQPEIVSRWMSPDPLSDEFPKWSPYTFTNDNPIYFVDPDGMAVIAPQFNQDDFVKPLINPGTAIQDDYGIDKKGDINLIAKTDDNFDVLYAVDGNGNKVDTNTDGAVSSNDGVIVDKGVLNNKKTNTVTASNGKEYTFDQYNVTGDGKATNLFEFVSDNSNVEWSITGVGLNNGENGNNILTTSHIENSEIGGGYLFAKGFSIRYSNHSHPYSNNASLADRNFTKSLNEKFTNARTKIYHKGSYTIYNQGGSITPISLKPIPIVEIKN